MNERRKNRLESFLRDTISEFFLTDIEPPVGVLISIHAVEIIESGSKANIFVGVYPESEAIGVAEMLKMSENKASHFVRTRLGSKHVPMIRFHVR